MDVALLEQYVLLCFFNKLMNGKVRLAKKINNENEVQAINYPPLDIF